MEVALASLLLDFDQHLCPNVSFDKCAKKKMAGNEIIHLLQFMLQMKKSDNGTKKWHRVNSNVFSLH